MLRGEPLLQLGVPAGVVRVSAQVVPEQPLVAGVPGVGRHHVQVVRALPVLVPVIEQPVRHAGIEPAVAQAVQVVFPAGHGV
jgi:hypothetical protein